MITLSDKIQLDIQNKSVSLIPLVLIDVVRDELNNITNNPIYISTNKGLFDGTTFWEDRGLKLSSIKESIDLVGRKFKINKLSFSLNNFPVNGVRFSDFVAERDLLNKTVEVYYKTQSCTTLDDCVLAYKGNIRRLDHDSKSVKIQLEDLTEDKLSKKIPIGNTGYKTSVYKKEDLNRIIPIVYGKVEKAPLIALLEERPLLGETSIKLIPDDISRDISITEFFADPSTESLDSGINPLYIYKDDYFQALQEYNYSVIDDPPNDDGSDNWNWSDYSQYNIQENHLEVLKKYTGTSTTNPVADNEIQCIKRRFPNDMKIIPNPVGLSQEELEADGGWQDAVGLGVIFDDPYIKSPEASYDNPYISLSKARNWYTPNLDDNHLSTFAQAPDQTQIFSSIWDWQIADFAPDSGYGVQNGSNYRWQQMITSWLMRYSHHFNSETIDEELHISEDPRLLYIKLPNEEYLKEKCNDKLWEHFDAIFQGLGVLPQGFSIMAWANQGNPLPSLIGNFDGTGQPECRVNSYPNMNGSAARDWATQSGCFETVDDYLSAPNDSYNLFRHGDYESSDVSTSFGNIATDTWEDSNQRIKYPNFCVQFELMYRDFVNNWGVISGMIQQLQATSFGGAYQDGTSWTLGILSPEQLESVWLGAFEDKHWVNISLENESRTEYEKGGTFSQGGNFEDAFYFNFFQIEGQNYDYLYDVNDFPMYAPFHCTSKWMNGWRCYPQYSCHWNGVSHDSTPDVNHTATLSSSSYPFFGWYGLKGLNGYGSKYQRESWMLTGSDTNDSWFIWMKDATEDTIGTQQTPTASGETHYPELGIVRTPANTLFACKHISRKQYGGSVYALHKVTGYGFGLGTEVSADDNYITLFKGDPTEQRLGFIFPFNEQEISGDIKTDTYFDGKLKLEFTEETAGYSNYHQMVVLGAVDVSEDDVFIWSVFDNNADNTGAVLIDQPLNVCKTTNPTTWYDSSVYDSEAESEAVDGVINLYDGELESVTDDFFEVNNYNALALLYRVRYDSDNPSSARVSQFLTSIYSVSLVHYIVFEGAFDDQLYANVIGRANTIDDVIDVNGNELFKYTGGIVTPPQGDTDEDDLAYRSQKVEIDKPCDIIYHFLEKELNLIDAINTDSIEIARAYSNAKFGFSFFEEKKGKDFINELCKSCNLFPLFKSTSEFSLTTIKNTYSYADVSTIIKSDEIIKYSFTRTPVEKIHTMVNVKYKMDYAEDELMEQTGYVDGYDMFGNMDDANRSGSWNPQALGGSPEIEFKGYSYDYLGIDVEDKVLDFESNFIRTYDSAKQLRNFLYMWNCNQRNIFKLTLPLKYLALEVGDVVAFDSLIDNMKAYGEDYTTSNTRNGQEIYPFFIVHSVDKKQKNINVEVTQLHNLQPNFTPYVGSVSRTRGIKLGQFEPFSLSQIGDLEILQDFLDGGQPYYTETQRRVSDVNENGYIDNSDVDALASLLINGEYLFGDINGDTVVNVTDIIMLVNAILGEEVTDEMLDLMDLNDDGSMNVTDIIMLVNIIIGNE